jgi:hypothetical protein
MTGMLLGMGATMAGTMVEVAWAEMVTKGVASCAAWFDCGVCAVDGVARGVVLITSGCPQFVSTQTKSRSKQ